MATLNSNIPAGPLSQKWESYKFNVSEWDFIFIASPEFIFFCGWWCVFNFVDDVVKASSYEVVGVFWYCRYIGRINIID